MSAILMSLFSILSNVPGMLGDYFKKKQEIENQKLNAEFALEIERAKLAAELAKSDYQRASASLQSTGQWFKYCVFWLISSPFIACLIGQQWYALMLFDNLRALPEWYMILYSAIIGVIWGIPVPGSVMGNVWAGMKQAAANHRDYKIAKMDRKLFYDALRKMQGYVSPDDVKKFNHVLDKAESE